MVPSQMYVTGYPALKASARRGANILCEYLGGAINCDAWHMTDPRADGLGVSTCIKLALQDAGVEPEQVGPALLILC